MTAREARTVRWGGTVAGGILFYVLLLDPYLARSAETLGLAEERETRLARLVALQRSLPSQEERIRLAQSTWRSQVEPRLLPGDVPAVAAAALSEEVRAIAAQSFLDVERESVLPAMEQAGLTGIPVQFSLRGDVYGLRDFLAALEATRTFLHLRELRVNATAAGSGLDQLEPAPLQVTVTLEGYLGGPGAASAGGTSAGTAPEVEAVEGGNLVPPAVQVPDAVVAGPETVAGAQPSPPAPGATRNVAPPASIEKPVPQAVGAPAGGRRLKGPSTGTGATGTGGDAAPANPPAAPSSVAPQAQPTP